MTTPIAQVTTMRIATFLTLGIGLLFAGCASPETTSSTREYVPVSGFNDVHGIAVNPDDPSELYVATHNGLIRGKNATWERVGSIQDDYMGFSMHPSNGSTFWTSGHPKTGGNMGVRYSTDGGFTWTQLSLDGVDFHAMTISPADANVLWGAWRGSIYHSADAGKTWATYANAPVARSLTAHPTNKDTLYAMTQTGIQRSVDAGKTWTPFSNIAAVSLAVDPGDLSIMYAGLATGVTKSRDGGRTWEPLPMRTTAPVGYLAIDPTDHGVVWAATYATAIHRTADAGQSWTEVKPPRAS